MSDRIAVFNEGRIEQVGTPEEIYEHPATEFVAGFVGVSNVLERDGPPLHDPPREDRDGSPATAAAERPGRSRTSSTSARSRATSSISTRGDS